MKLRDLIEEELNKGVSRRSLAKNIGVSLGTIQNILIGDTELMNSTYVKFINYFGSRLVSPKIGLAEVARWHNAQQQQSNPAPDQLPAAGGQEMLFKSLISQIGLLNDMIREMKNERAELIGELKEEQKRCWARINDMQTHAEKMDETIDKINLDVGRVKNRMLDAARTGDIHHLEKISDAG